MFSDCHPIRRAGVVLLAVHPGRQTGAGIAAAGRDQLRPARAILRRAPPGSTYVPAHIENGKTGSRSRETGESRALLSDAPWLRSGPAARVLALLNGDGEEAARGRRRRAQRAAERCRSATSTSPPRRCRDEVVRRAEAAGIKCGADRHRPRHRHAWSSRAHPFEVTTLARGYRDLRPQGQGRASGATGVRDAERRDFTINALSVDADGIVHDHVGGLADHRSATRALHRRCQPAHRRGLFAHPALLPHPCRLRRG